MDHDECARMRLVVLLAAFLLAGCGSAPAPETTQSTPEVDEPTELPVENATLPPLVAEAQLYLDCHTQVDTLYVYSCGGDDTGGTDDRGFAFNTTGASQIIIDARHTGGDEAQIAIRGDIIGDWYLREDLADEVQIVLEPLDWGDQDSLIVELAAKEHVNEAGTSVWFSRQVNADVTVTTIFA